MIRSEPIYTRGNDGRLREWWYEVDGDRYRVLSGLIDGKKAESGWKRATPKNEGRSNATTGEQQALFEAEANRRKRLEKQYRERLEDVDLVPKGPMLADSFDRGRMAQILGLGNPVWVQPKLDGIRANFNRHGAWTRGFKPHHNVAHIWKALEPLRLEYPHLVVDGELYNHDLRDDFNKITSVVRKQNVTQEQAEEASRLIQFHVYDVFSLRPDLDEGRPFTGSYGRRLDFLSEVHSHLDALGVGKVVPSRFCQNMATVDEAHGWCIENGYEGSMIRLDSGPYEPDERSSQLLKRKDFITEEYPVVRFEEGQGNWAGAAKRVIVLRNGNEEEAGMRGTYGDNAELLRSQVGPNAVATIRFFTPTPDGKMRFPVMVDYHPDGRTD